MNRFFAFPLTRIVVVGIAVLAPVMASLALIQNLIDKPYRQVWPLALAAALCVIAYAACARWIERRRVDEFSREGALAEFARGTALGVGMIVAVVAVLAASGVATVTGRGDGGWIGPLVEMAFAAVLEEVLFRGVVQRVLENWLGPIAALVVASVLFALAHTGNSGMSGVAFAAILIAGFLLGGAYLVTHRLWLPIGVHFGWNFTTDGIFGLVTSGARGHGLLHTDLSGPDWLTGGAWGVEASAVTLVITGAVAAILIWRSLARRPA